MRSMWKGVLKVTTVWLTLAQGAQAVTSNRNEVREDLGEGYHIVWGHNFTEGDWAEGLGAIAASVATENPGPFIEFFDHKLQQNVNKIRDNLQGVAVDVIESWIKESLKKKKFVVYNGFRIEAGFATYQRWERIVYDVPETYRCKWKGPLGTWTWGKCTRSVQKERRIPMPNHNQFYVRFRFVNEVPAGVSEYHRVHFENRCSQPVYIAARFRTLSGDWSTQGFWSVKKGKSVYAFNTKNNVFYYTAATHNGSLHWQGADQFTVSGKKYGFKKKDINSNRFLKHTQILTCGADASIAAAPVEIGVRSFEEGTEGGELEAGVEESEESGGWETAPIEENGGWNSSMSYRSDEWGVESAALSVDWENVESRDYSGLGAWGEVSAEGASEWEVTNGGWN